MWSGATHCGASTERARAKGKYLFLKEFCFDKRPADLKLVFENSMSRVFVFEDGRLVGVGRALADGRDCSYLCDIAVLPDQQGRGLGKEIVDRLVRLSAGHRKIILYSVPGREPFYEAFGFRRMMTAMAIFEDPAKALRNGYLQRV